LFPKDEKVYCFERKRPCSRPELRLSFPWLLVQEGSQVPFLFEDCRLDAERRELTADATREVIEAAGFRTLAWQDDSEAGKTWFAQLRASGPPPSPNLGVVMGPDFLQLT